MAERTKDGKPNRIRSGDLKSLEQVSELYERPEDFATTADAIETIEERRLIRLAKGIGIVLLVALSAPGIIEYWQTGHMRYPWLTLVCVLLLFGYKGIDKLLDRLLAG